MALQKVLKAICCHAVGLHGLQQDPKEPRYEFFPPKEEGCADLGNCAILRDVQGGPDKVLHCKRCPELLQGLLGLCALSNSCHKGMDQADMSACLLRGFHVPLEVTGVAAAAICVRLL